MATFEEVLGLSPTPAAGKTGLSFEDVLSVPAPTTTTADTGISFEDVLGLSPDTPDMPAESAPREGLTFHWFLPIRKAGVTGVVGGPPESAKALKFTAGGKLTLTQAAGAHLVYGGAVAFSYTPTMLGMMSSEEREQFRQDVHDDMYVRFPLGVEEFGKRWDAASESAAIWGVEARSDVWDATPGGQIARNLANKLGFGDEALKDAIYQTLRRTPDMLAGVIGLPGIVGTEQVVPAKAPTTTLGKAGVLLSESVEYFGGMAKVGKFMGVKGLPKGAALGQRVGNLAMRSLPATIASEAGESDINPARAWGTFRTYFALMGVSDVLSGGLTAAVRGIAGTNKAAHVAKGMMDLADKGLLGKATAASIRGGGKGARYLLVDRADDWIESVFESFWYSYNMRPEGSSFLGAFLAALPSSLFWNYMSESVGDVPGMVGLGAAAQAKADGRKFNAKALADGMQQMRSIQMTRFNELMRMSRENGIEPTPKEAAIIKRVRKAISDPGQFIVQTRDNPFGSEVTKALSEFAIRVEGTVAERLLAEEAGPTQEAGVEAEAEVAPIAAEVAPVEGEAIALPESLEEAKQVAEGIEREPTRTQREALTVPQTVDAVAVDDADTLAEWGNAVLSANNIDTPVAWDWQVDDHQRWAVSVYLETLDDGSRKVVVVVAPGAKGQKHLKSKVLTKLKKLLPSVTLAEKKPGKATPESLGIKAEDTVRVLTEMQALRARYEAETRAAKAGHRLGTAEARAVGQQQTAEAKAAAEAKAQELEAVREELIAFISDNLPQQDIWRMLRRAQKVKTRKGLQSAIQQVEQVAVGSAKREAHALLERNRAKATLTEAHVKERLRRQQLEAWRAEVAEFARLRLPSEERGKAMVLLNRVKSEKGFARAIKAIEKIAARVDLRNAQGQLRGTMKKLKKTKLGSPFYEIVNDILAGLDAHKPSGKKLDSLLKLTEHVQRTPEHEVPDYVMDELKRLSKLPVSELTAVEADAVTEVLENLIAQDRLKKNIRNDQRERDHDRKIERMLDQLGKSDIAKREKKIIGQAEAGPNVFKAAYRAIGNFHQSLVRSLRMTRYLDGGAEGAHVEYLHKPIDQKTIEKNLNVYRETEAFFDWAKANKINLQQMVAKGRVINDHLTHTPNQAIEVFLATMLDNKLGHLMAGNGHTKEDINDVLDGLTEQERALASHILDYYERNWEPIALIHQEESGQALERQTGRYSPCMLEHNTLGFQEQVGIDAITRAFTKTRTQVERGFTIPVRGGAEPLKLDAIGNFLQNIQRIEHYKAFAKVTRDIQKLLHDKNWQTAVKELPNGAAIIEELQRWLENSAGVGSQEPPKSLARAVNWFRRNAAVGMIGFNALSGMRASVSMMHSIGYEGDSENLRYHLDSAAAFSDDPFGAWRQAHDILPDLDLRFLTNTMNRELQQEAQRVREQRIRGGVMGMVSRNKSRLSSAALYHYKLVDGITTSICTLAHYNKMRDRGFGHEKARDYARHAIESTQPMGDKKDLPGLFRQGPLAQMFTMFQNMISQEYNIMTRDMPDIWRRRGPGIKGIGKASKQTFWLMAWSKIIPAWLLATIGRGRTPTADEFGKDMLMYTILPVWPIGLFASMIRGGYESVSIPPIAFASEAGKASASTTWEGRIKHGAKSAGLLLGVPTIQPARTLEGIIDLSSGNTDDFRRLNWSEWNLREPEQPTPPLRLR